MAEESVLSLKSLEILIKWKWGELLEHEEGGPPAHRGYIVLCSGGRTNGTDGFEESLQSLIVKRLREKVVKLDDLAKVLEVFTLEPNSHILYANQWEIFRTLEPLIRQTISNVSSELLQMQKRNPTMRLEEFKVYFDPVCWSSRKRLDFFSCLSNTLTEDYKWPEIVQLSQELEQKWQRHFCKSWIDKIDPNLINIINPKHRPRSPSSVVSLLRFVRNRWNHRKELRELFQLDSAEDFYNYFSKLFPDLLMVSYGVADQLCREEPWFKKFRPMKHEHVDTHRTRSDTRSTHVRNPTRGQPLPDTFGHTCPADNGGLKRRRGSRDRPTASLPRPETARERAARKGVMCGERRGHGSAALANQEKRKGCAASSKGKQRRMR